MVAPVVRSLFMGAAGTTVPGALATDIILFDAQTGLQYMNFTTPNRVVDITNLNSAVGTDPAAGINYFVKLVKNGREVRRWYSQNLISTVNVHVGFPMDLLGGSYQWVAQQTLGALTYQNWVATFFQDM